MSENPFGPNEPDRRELWHMLMQRDFEAFVAQDWGMVESDFLAESFFGLHAGFQSDADQWRMQFPRLEIYRDEWLRQAKESAETEYAEPLLPALLRAVRLDDIDLDGDRAVLHKKFDGTVQRADGTEDRLKWQTLYFCRKVAGRWRIAGFVGYMPLPLCPT